MSDLGGARPVAGPGALVGREDECAALDRLLADVRGGGSRALVLRGAAGTGKSALLEHLVARSSGCRVVAAAAVRSEMELPFAAVHQLCAPLLDLLDVLPGPLRDALGTAFGMRAGPAPDPSLVGLAVRGLLAGAAAERPLVCAIDDAQWFDGASSRVLDFVARRPVGARVACVFAARDPADTVVPPGLPVLDVGGLPDGAARALAARAAPGPLDPEVRERILCEARGNPRVLLDLIRGTAAGGFIAATPARPPTDRAGDGPEDGVRHRLDGLPADGRT
ncbi:BREX system ATP-binding domain-containing protein, partial [Actinomadura sp. LOL_011]